MAQEERPRLMVDRAMDKEIPWSSMPRPGHCDPRVLHHPSVCVVCAGATELQEERERLDVSHTAMRDRKWPCPADLARTPKQYYAWGGNRPWSEARQQAYEAVKDDIKILEFEVGGDEGDPGDSDGGV